MVIDELCILQGIVGLLLLFYSFPSLPKSSSMETVVIQDAASIDTTMTREEKKPKHACHQWAAGINYGWIIVAASFLVLVINYGVIHSW